MRDICSKCGFDMDAQFEARARLIDKYEKGCANLESELAHLRQENAGLKAELFKCEDLIKIFKVADNLKSFEKCATELQRHKDVLGKCREALEGVCDSWMAQFGRIYEEGSRVDKAHKALALIKSLHTPPSPKPTTDPATSIAYGLYPSSARPVNPNPSKSENWVGYTPIDPQSK